MIVWTCSSEQVRNTQADGVHLENSRKQKFGLNLLRIMLCYFRHLSRSLGILDAVFMSDRQQDATEFLVRLLDLFRDHFSSSDSDVGLEGWYLLTQLLMKLKVRRQVDLTYTIQAYAWIITSACCSVDRGDPVFCET